MAGEKQGYKLTVAGPGHNFEREVDEAIASQIISLVMTGRVSQPAGGAHSQGTSHGGGAIGRAHAASHGAPVKVGGSLASHIKAKKGDKKSEQSLLSDSALAHWSERKSAYGKSCRRGLSGS